MGNLITAVMTWIGSPMVTRVVLKAYLPIIVFR